MAIIIFSPDAEEDGEGKSANSDHSAFKEEQHGDAWTNDEHAQFIYEKLILLRELLSDK